MCLHTSRKKILVYPLRLIHRVLSYSVIQLESLTFFLNKNIFIEKGVTLSSNQEKGSKSLLQRISWRNVDWAPAFQHLLSLTNVSSLIAKVACLVVYGRRQVRHD